MGRVVGIVVVAVVVGLVSVPSVAARTPEVGTASGPDAAAIDLLGYVPADVRGSCEIGAPTAEDAGTNFAAEAASISAYLECNSGNGDVDFTSFTKFTNLAAMNRVYDAFVAGAPPTPTRSEEGDCPEDSTWRFRETRAGRVLCFYATFTGTGEAKPESATRVWTYDDALILGTAQVPSTDAATLFEWWDDEAGPLQNKEKVSGLASTSPAQVRAAEKRLRSQIPRDQRDACVAIDVDDPQSSRQVFFRARLFVQAAFACDEAEGVSSLTYASIDPEVIDAFFLRYRSFSDVPEGENCPGDATYSVGKGDKKRRVGVYACFTKDAGTPSEAAEIRWIQRKLGFYGGAEIAGGSLDDVYRFWEQKTGPV